MINYIKSSSTIEFEFIGGDNNNTTMEEVIALVESKFLIYNNNDGTNTTSVDKVKILKEENRDLEDKIYELENEIDDLRNGYE